MAPAVIRLTAIERQLRFHRLVIAGLLVALVALVGYGAAKGVPDVIRARSVEVVDSQGRPLVSIGRWLPTGAVIGGQIAIHSTTEDATSHPYAASRLAVNVNGAGFLYIHSVKC